MKAVAGRSELIFPTLSFYSGVPDEPIGYGYELGDPLARVHKRHKAQVRMLQMLDCRIFILSAFPE